nr:reverse transcriptase domain-containing protein [Tanacetum cinerariifolium]
MAEGDEDKTAFFAGEWVFCYQKMPFDLKNARATYQRLVDKVFHDQIGRNVEAYVDDMVIHGLMMIDLKRKEYTYALCFGFEATNNKAEYEALLARLRITQDMEIISLKTKEVLKGSDSYTIEHIRRNQNKKVYALNKLASMTFEHLTNEVLVEVLSKRSIEEKEILQVETKEEESRMTPIHEYLVSDLLKEDLKESRKIRVKAPLYKLIRGSLYRRATLNGGQNYKERILLAIDVPRRCKGLKFLAIAVEHSTEWVEAKPLTTINGKHAERFVWEYVVCRFGVPRTISLKDKKHFREGIFVDLCKGLKVTQSFSPITEHIKIMNHIKKQLTRSQQGCVDDLAQVLWVYKTLPSNSQKETPFSLTYGSDAIIPIAKNTVAKDDMGRTKEVTKRKESKEVALIEEAHYQNKLHKYHNERSNHCTYKIGDFILLSQNDAGNPQVWQGPHMKFTTENSKNH